MAEEKKVEEVKDETTDTKEVDTSKLTDNAKKVLEIVEQMTIIELADLVKVMEEKFGVSAAAPVAVAAAGGAETTEQAEEKSNYDVELTQTGDKKMEVIKALREINNTLGLMEAKEVAESAPKVILEKAKKEDAEAAKEKLEAAGATVTLK